MLSQLNSLLDHRDSHDQQFSLRQSSSLVERIAEPEVGKIGGAVGGASWRDWLLVVRRDTGGKLIRRVDSCYRIVRLLRKLAAQWRSVKWYLELCGVRGVLTVALFRLCKWPKELIVFPFRNTEPICLRIDTSDFCSYRDVLIFKTKSYTPDKTEYEPRTIVDVGAHIGMSAILFAREYPNAEIFALEPEVSNYAALRRNAAPYKNITCVQAALWREDGEVELSRSTAHPKGAFQVSELGTERVRAITMTTLMKENEITTIDLLKLDIEGAEKEVFQDCNWTARVRILAIELHDRVRPGCTDIVYHAMRGHRFEKKGDIVIFLNDSALRAPAA
jgi:FkbM family methyltransferase